MDSYRRNIETNHITAINVNHLDWRAIISELMIIDFLSNSDDKSILFELLVLRQTMFLFPPQTRFLNKVTFNLQVLIRFQDTRKKTTSANEINTHHKNMGLT